VPVTPKHRCAPNNGAWTIRSLEERNRAGDTKALVRTQQRRSDHSLTRRAQSQRAGRFDSPRAIYEEPTLRTRGKGMVSQSMKV